MKTLLCSGFFVWFMICAGHTVMAQEDQQANPFGSVLQQADEAMQQGSSPLATFPEVAPRSPFGDVPQVQQQKSQAAGPRRKENLSPSESLWSLATPQSRKTTAPAKTAPISQKLMPSTFGNVEKGGGVNPFGGVRQSGPPGPFGNVPLKMTPSSR